MGNLPPKRPEPTVTPKPQKLRKPEPPPPPPPPKPDYVVSHIPSITTQTPEELTRHRQYWCQHNPFSHSNGDVECAKCGLVWPKMRQTPPETSNKPTRQYRLTFGLATDTTPVFETFLDLDPAEAKRIADYLLDLRHVGDTMSSAHKGLCK